MIGNLRNLWRFQNRRQRVFVLFGLVLLLASCSIEGENSTQKQRAQQMQALLRREISTEELQRLVVVPVSAPFCVSQRPKIEQMNCINRVVAASSAAEAPERLQKIRDAISKTCATKNFGKR